MRYARTIYWRATVLQNGEEVRAGGAFGDLKTFKGAIARVMRQFPDWREVEARHEPFPPVGATAAPNPADAAGIEPPSEAEGTANPDDANGLS